MFLTKYDLNASIYSEIVDMMALYTDAIIDMQLAQAEGEIEMYLGARFLIRPELEKQGDDRHTYLLGIGIDLAIYHLYSLQETIPSHREKRYEQRIAILKLMQDGKSALPGVPLLPPPTVDAVTYGQIAWGSQKKRVNLSDVM